MYLTVDSNSFTVHPKNQGIVSMKIVFIVVSVVCFAITIASFGYVIYVLKEPVEYFFNYKNQKPDAKFKYQISTGTVYQIDNNHVSSTTMSGSLTSGSTDIYIKFHDEKNNTFQIDCYGPLFNNFKKGQQVRILHMMDSYSVKKTEQYRLENLKREKEGSSYRDYYSVPGIPLSILYWIQKPLIFGAIGCVSLLLGITAIFAFRSIV